MPVCTLNEMFVSRAVIDIPRIGVWHADLVVDSFESFTGKATIQFVSQTFNGTFARNGPDINRKLRARVIGGAGLLSSLLPPKGYQSVPIRIPLTDAVTSCKEQLSSTCDNALLNTTLSSWYRLQMSGSQTIDALLQSIQFLGTQISTVTNLPSWRMLTEGKIWVGYEYWKQSVTTDAIPLYSEPERGNITFYADDPVILPGETLTYEVPGVGSKTRKVSHVRHWITPRRMHTTVYYEDD